MRYRGRPAGFTLVELMVVVGIIIALLAVLLPAVAGARESSNRIRCACNLRQIGQVVYLFAHDHHGRVPEAQDTPHSGAGAWNPTWMYTKDYFSLVDDYRASQQLFICPSGPTADTGPSAFPYGDGNELAARTTADGLPDDPGPVASGDPDLTRHWMGTDYVWMGRNIQETLPPAAANPNGAPFEVTRLTANTFTGLPLDADPPLMADAVAYRTSGTYQFTHGRRWHIPSFDATPSLFPWYRGTGRSCGRRRRGRRPSRGTRGTATAWHRTTGCANAGRG
jgi:type II secretory pathway pseudopilin PulG